MYLHVHCVQKKRVQTVFVIYYKTQAMLTNLVHRFLNKYAAK